jgi:hypothetical protein
VTRLALAAFAVLCAACGSTGHSSSASDGGRDAGSSSDDANAQDADADDEGGDAAPDSMVWSVVSADVQGDVLAIWGPGHYDVFVGTDTPYVSELRGGLIQSVVPGQGAIVGAGWGGSMQGAYAAGASAWLEQAGKHAPGGLFQFTGSRVWQLVDSRTFTAVWGSSPEDVYAVGPAGVAHSLGGGPFVNEPSAGTEVVSVWGSGATDVYVTTMSDAGAILHSSGDGGWSPVASQTAGSAWMLWGSSAGDVYALVSLASTAAPDARIVHSSADAGWSTSSLGTPSTTLVAIAGSGRNDVYAGGWQEGSPRMGVLFHSLGDGQWSAVDLPGQPYQVTAIWCVTANDVYVGLFDVQAGPMVLRGQR